MASAGWGGQGGLGCRVCSRKAMLSAFPTLPRSLPSPGSSGQGGCLVSELQVGLLLLFFHPLVPTVMVLSREVPFRVLGRSRQQGRTVMKTVDSAVFAVKDVGPRQPARGARTQVKAGGQGGAWGSPQHSHSGRGLAQEGVFRGRGGGWCRARRMGAFGQGGGRAPGPGPRHRVDSRDESRMSSWWLVLLESLS